MATKKKAAKKYYGNALHTWRPKPKDVAALDALMKKKGLDESNTIRLALFELLEKEGLRDQVEKRAHLLDSVGA